MTSRPERTMKLNHRFVLSGAMIAAALLILVVAEHRGIRPLEQRRTEAVQRSAASNAASVSTSAELESIQAANANIREQIAGTQRTIDFLKRYEEPSTPEAKKAKATNAASQQLREAAKYRRDLGRRLAPLQRALALTPEQTEELITILTESWQSQSDLWAAAAAARVPRSDPAIVEARRTRRADEKNALTSLLGEAGYRAYRQYDQARTVVYGVVDRLRYSDTQLSRGLADDLTDVVARQVATSGSPLEALAQPSTWNAILSDARVFLSAEQMAGLERTRDEYEADQDLSLVVAAARKRLSSQAEVRPGAP